MRVSRQIFCEAGVLFLSLSVVLGQTRQSVVPEKLHPAFQALISGKPAVAEVSLSKTNEPLYEASITTTNADAVRSLGIHLNSVFGTIATARITVDQLKMLIELNDVKFVDPGSENYPTLDVSVPEIGANLLHSGFLNNTQYKGKGVIVVIYDTGIDWRHLDFRDPLDTTKSRILSIWDQTLTAGGSEIPPGGSLMYGVEYTKQHIENEIDGTPANFVREKDINGHGTHVAGTIAGNARATGKYLGVAPEADIIVVKGGDGSFTSGRMIDGLTYASNKANAAGKPLVVNWSIGGQSGPHDGSRDYEVAVDSFSTVPGKVVVISAGNDGDANIHGSGNITSGGTSSLSINVPPFVATAGALNNKFAIDVWFNSDVSLTATVTSPNGVTASAGVQSSTSAANESDGSVDLFNYLEVSTGYRYVQLVVQDRDANKVPRTGTWTLSFTGASKAAAYDAWLTSYKITASEEATIVNGNTQKTVSSPGTSIQAITVASYVTRNGWPSINGNGYAYSAATPMLAISAFSSQGPTGDGRLKPEISAPGHGISSSLSGWAQSSIEITRLLPDGRHTLMEGTSMAAPHVAGAAALLLQISKNLTASQIKTLLTSTAVVDAGTGAVPNSTWGYGRMDLFKAAAKAVDPQLAVQRQIFSSDTEGNSGVFGPPLTGSTRLAYRFTPAFAGRVTGVYANTSSAANRSVVGTGSLVCEIWSNASGNPGVKLGSSVLKPFQALTVSTNNFVDMTSAGVNVNPNQDYHVVIYTSNSQDTLKIRTDAVALVDRYSQASGGNWSNVTFGNNLRIRATVTSNSGLTLTEQDNLVPLHFDLSQNYPNPFNPSTTIRYTLPEAGRARLRVFDLVGREVALLVDEEQIAGQYFVRWDATDNSGRPLSSGVYFCKLESGGRFLTRKMLLMK